MITIGQVKVHLPFVLIKEAVSIKQMFLWIVPVNNH